MGMEEYVVVLDYLAHGHVDGERPLYRREPVVYAIGETFLTLMELVPKRGVQLKAHDRVYVGKDERREIDYIKRRVSYNDLSSAAKSELPYVVEEIVARREKKFLEFFNQAQPLTTRLHGLELLPGIGKKLMWEILEERKKRPFESFADMAQRIRVIPDPKKPIARRIVAELQADEARTGKAKYKLFTIPLSKKA